jgi:hypothetical protein
MTSERYLLFGSGFGSNLADGKTLAGISYRVREGHPCTVKFVILRWRLLEHNLFVTLEAYVS